MNTLEPLSTQIASCIPLDKSWEIRRIILALLDENISSEEIQKLSQQNKLSNDLVSLYKCANSWILGDEKFHVGESGTLYRFLRFLTWKSKKETQFIREGSLAERTICDNPQIVHFQQQNLLKLDNGTSQWASAAVLGGDKERLSNPPFKLQVTYDAVEINKKGYMTQKRDATIETQVRAFLEWKKTGNMNFTAKQAEDYPFARAFQIITREEGGQEWPALATHESDRLDGFEKHITEHKKGEIITVNDHRPVAALALRYGLSRDRFFYPDSVNKSWPQFWDFMDEVSNTSF